MPTFPWLLLLLLSPALAPSPARAASPHVPPAAVMPAGGFEVGLAGTMFFSEGRWDHDGNAEDLPEGDSFVQTDVGLAVRYGFGGSVEFFGGAGARGVSAREAMVDYSASGLSSVRAGARVSLLRRGRWLLSAEGSHARSLHDEPEPLPPGTRGTGDPILGVSGATSEAQARLAWLYSPGTLVSASGGYRLRPAHLASEFPWAAELALHGRRLALVLGADGAVSMGDDGHEALPGGGIPIDRPRYHQPSTARFNSFNRSWMRASLGLGLAAGSWRIEASAGRMLRGVSTDRGFDVGLGIVWAAGGSERGARRVDSFKEYVDAALVTKVSPRGRFIKIDKGTARNIDKGMRVDVFESDFSGKNVLHASGVVYESTARSSIVMIKKQYRKKKVKKGFTARLHR